MSSISSHMNILEVKISRQININKNLQRTERILQLRESFDSFILKRGEFFRPVPACGRKNSWFSRS